MLPKDLEDGAVKLDLDRCYAAADRQREVSRRSQALLAAAGMDAPARRWFVVTVENAMDHKVAGAMLFAGVECWLPHIVVVPTRRGGMKAGDRKPVKRLAMPGYVFASVKASVEAWSGVLSIKGTVGILGSSGKPMSVGDDNVSLLKAYLSNDPAARDTVMQMIKLHEKVVINDGPLLSHSGTVETLDVDRGRAIVDVLIFGRLTPTEVDLAQLSKL